jgi:hypothetical protein
MNIVWLQQSADTPSVNGVPVHESLWFADKPVEVGGKRQSAAGCGRGRWIIEGVRDSRRSQTYSINNLVQDRQWIAESVDQRDDWTAGGDGIQLLEV